MELFSTAAVAALIKPALDRFLIVCSSLLSIVKMPLALTYKVLFCSHLIIPSDAATLLVELCNRKNMQFSHLNPHLFSNLTAKQVAYRESHAYFLMRAGFIDVCSNLVKPSAAGYYLASRVEKGSFFFKIPLTERSIALFFKNSIYHQPKF